MRARVALGAVMTALSVLALAPALASACSEPKVELARQSIGAGETTAYTIVNVQAGGEFTLTVEGHVIASGVSASEHGHSGTTAPMPDLGAARSVSVVLHATHNGPIEPGHETGPWTHSATVRFASQASAPVASAEPSGERPAPAAAEGPAAATTPAAGAPRTPSGSRASTAVRPRARATTPGRAAARAPGRSVRSVRSIRTPRTVAPAVVAAPAPVGAAAKAPSAQRTAAGSGAGRPAARRDLAAPARALPAPRAATPVAAPRTARGDETGAAGGVLAALLIGLLAHGAATLARLRRRVPATAPPDTEELDALGIEHELQQIIAAAREKTPA